MKITNDIYYIGINDKNIDLFEGQYKVKNGMAYNSYVIIDEKIAVFDTVEREFGDLWLENLNSVLNGKEPDYLIVQHMEPDHSANIDKFISKYPSAKIISTSKSFGMMKQFFETDYIDNQIIVNENDTLSLGNHNLTFITAPMVHWPEVMITYESSTCTLFSADAFGKFGTMDAKEPWIDEARRYYIGIVGKYGVQVQNVLKKAATIKIERICSLHGPILDKDLSQYIKLYDLWSSYKPEEDGILIAYTSIYGNTKYAVELLANELKENNYTNVKIMDLTRCDIHEAVAQAFKYSKLILATTTYNADIFPAMKEFINHLTERNYKNRQIGIIENGTWAPACEKIIKKAFESSNNINFLSSKISIKSKVSDENIKEIKDSVKELI